MAYSQAGQDIFVNHLFKDPNRFFLDFGCGDGINKPCGNNTMFLEQMGWNGISIDINPDYINRFNQTRKTKAYCIDLTKVDIVKTMKEIGCPRSIDYFSFDIDDATLRVLNNFPFDYFEFKFITFEHDLYRGQYALKAFSNKLFEDQGYRLLFENVSFSGVRDNELVAVEDWYVNPKFFDYPCIKKGADSRSLIYEYEKFKDSI